jgi:hypothetical protein
MAVTAFAAEAQVQVTADIAVSTTWTANNTYSLTKQIYVLPGATLTIQAGTIIASATGVGGSLAVCKGAQIYVQGTERKPVIFTSAADVATWTGGNPRTGTWREKANEWGNLTIMGGAYISENAITGNVPSFANNIGAMEGLVAANPSDTRVYYGGANDDDNSGTIGYCSLRYGGKVVALNNELNGLSLGGIGRGTDIHHVEIMNNVDDGVEIWGGAVNLKNISIWNVGDDSFDIDQGWRGKAQFILVVQGWSLDAAQGSGVGDNCFEMDGGEDSDWQPVTTGSIYNVTAIGQPFDARGATAWRDNARVQFHNCIFMDAGREVVRFDNKDGDGANGYGYNGTLTWAQTWTTPYTSNSTVNAPPNPALYYKSQTSGMLAEITDSVFFNNTYTTAYTEATARGVFAAANNNVKEPANMPIQALTRGAAVVKGGKAMVQATFVDPRPANNALVSVGYAPRDGFYASAKYRGAFAPGNNWLSGWTASEAYGFTPKEAWGDLGNSLAGTYGAPVLAGSGTLVANQATTLAVSNAKESSPAVFVVGAARQDVPLFGGTLVPSLTGVALLNFNTDASGKFSLNFPWPSGVPSNAAVYVQAWIYDTAGPVSLSATNAVIGVTP